MQLNPVNLFKEVFLEKPLPESSVIGILGSIGKSQTILSCQSVLEQKYKVSIFELGSNLNKNSKIERLIIELSPFQGLEIKLPQPKTLILTRLCLTSKGIESFEKEILFVREQISLLSDDGLIIANWDDPLIRKIVTESNRQTVFFGFDAKKCHVWADNIKITGGKTLFELNYGVERAEVLTSLLGKSNIYGCMAAVVLGLTNELSLFTIKKSFENLEPLEHRLKILEGVENWIVLDDSYDNSLVGIEESLDVLSGLPARRRCLVLGEIKNLGSRSEEIHQKVAQKIFKEKDVDLVLLTVGDTCYIKDELDRLGFLGKVEENLSNSQIVAMVLSNLGKGDIVLVKGAKVSRFDEIAKRISKQQ